MTLYERLSKIQTTNPYFNKDLEKAKKANKFIGRGSDASSTNKYRIAAGDLANLGVYEATDIVFISAEGQRRGRIDVDWSELDKAIASKVTFVTDNHYNRNRPFNIGERTVADYLIKNAYSEVDRGIWKK